ncbi:MAG: class I SAM-dependent methyltransferase [Corynebacterium sp.]|uniref:class I SAM-dependent methyltransferase n=1 Tax=Corynebacterium sp. TaxID=1720 RepID=UPI0026DD8837|nr:class I SAM-dependent methyltransferase [Corynebacterium sp.]MDO5098258.1 class I SAM-dependent methyltransferase [Corynebacterium sp.]
MSSDPAKDASQPIRPVPPISRKNMPKFVSDTHRNEQARAFRSGAELYQDVRPSYPTEVMGLLAIEHNHSYRILDVGAGTGKLTSVLGAAFGERAEVFALDPSLEMLKTLKNHGISAWQATAEVSAARNEVFDVVTCAQTWHWVDSRAASVECDRISTAEAQLLLVWNTLDVNIPWVHRLSRIMHSGDTLAEGFLPTVYAPWQLCDELRLRWEQPVTTQLLHRLMHTRSYWLRSTESVRDKMTANLHWYLDEHLGFHPDQEILLPYRCDAFLYRKQK